VEKFERNGRSHTRVTHLAGEMNARANWHGCFLDHR